MKGNNTILKVLGFPVAVTVVALILVFVLFFPCSSLWVGPIRRLVEQVGGDPLAIGLVGIALWGAAFLLTIPNALSGGTLAILAFNLMFAFGVPLLLSMWRAWGEVYDSYFFKEHE